MSIVSTLLAAGDPSQSPHWFIPKRFELIYGGLASVIIISALVKFAGPFAKKALTDRTEKIQNEIAGIEVVDKETAIQAIPGYSVQQLTLNTQQFFTLRYFFHDVRTFPRAHQYVLLAKGLDCTRLLALRVRAPGEDSEVWN